jgi:hypothetical protein
MTTTREEDLTVALLILRNHIDAVEDEVPGWVDQILNEGPGLPRVDQVAAFAAKYPEAKKLSEADMVILMGDVYRKVPGADVIRLDDHRD